MLESIFGLVSKKRLAVASDEIKFLKSSLESAEQSYSYVRGQMNELRQVNAALAKESTGLAREKNSNRDRILAMDQEIDRLRKQVVVLSDSQHAEKQGQKVAESEMTVQQFIDSNKLKISPMNLAQRAISLGGSRDSTAKARDKKGRLRTVKTFPVSILSKAVQIHNTPA